MSFDNTSNFLFYSGSDGKDSIQINVDSDNETVWTTQKGMSEIFNVDRSVITKHLKNIFEEQELIEDSVCAKFAHTAEDGKTYQTMFYNLDAIISVGYRVNSQSATRFRIWATQVLRDYLVKGFVMDDDRLKQGKTLFGKDYFDELLERIREIRASERRFYQKITDIYAQCSVDYNPNSPITHKFYATAQNKLEFAITKKTAPEIIRSRANSNKENMGLQTWKGQKKDGKIVKSDVSVAKNYLTEDELKELNSIVTMYLDYAELQAKRNKTMTMNDWADRLNSFLQFNDYEILQNAGSIKAEVAKKFAEDEYTKFRIIQDANFISDFDNVVEGITTGRSLPIERYDKNKFNGTFTTSIKDEIEKQRKILEDKKSRNTEDDKKQE